MSMTGNPTSTTHGGHACRAVAEWPGGPDSRPWRDLDGTWVLADVSGFTALTEALHVKRSDGAEVLHDVLTRCFDALLAHSIRLGGDLVHFAGDAALVRFDGADHQRRAAEAALAMPAGVADIPRSATGGRALRVSVGIHTAPILGVLTRTEQRGLFLVGPAASRLVRLEQLAPVGSVVASEEVAVALDPRWLGRRHGDTIRLRPAAVGPGPGPGPGTRSEPMAAGQPMTLAAGGSVPDRILAMYGPGVRRRLEAGSRSADHRQVSIGFVQIDGLEKELGRRGPAAVVGVVEPIADTVGRITSELSVEWLGTDIGLGGVKMLLTAGAPNAVPDDEERMMVALRRIVDECNATASASVSLRAGAQRGAVFAGDLGVPGRRTYTVLGDPVNVAARAAGLAEPGQVVVADGLSATDRPHAVTVPLGELALRNRRRPMSMWHLVSIDSPVARRPLMPASTARLVRVDELTSIMAVWREVGGADGAAMRAPGSPTPGAIAVVGDPGMGVSELVAEAAAVAGDAGVLVVPDPFRRPIPYGLIAELIELLHRAAGSPTVEQPGERSAATTSATAWLASFTPHLPAGLQPWVGAALGSLTAVPPAADVDPRLAATRTRATLVALIARAAPRPWLLAVDDIDAVDDTSRSVLTALASSVVAGRAGRTAPDAADADAGATFDRTMLVLGASRADLIGDVGMTTIELGPVDDDRARRLVRELAPLLRDDQVERVVAAAGGNPAVLAALAADPDAVSLPDSLQRLAAVQLDGLPPATRDLVREASVLGTSWTPTQIATILRRPELIDPVWWDAAESVVRVAGDGAMSFRHEAVRAVAYSSLPFARRRALHGEIADDMVGRSGGPVAALALHLEAAGRLDEALPHAIAAGRAARAGGALSEATDLLDRAVRIARGRDPGVVPDLLCELGQALVWLGDLDRGAAAYRSAALVLARGRRENGSTSDRGLGGDPSEIRRRIGWLSHLQADLALVRGKLDAASRHVRRGLDAIEPLGDEVATERCRLLLDRAWVHVERGQRSASLASAAVALVIAERIGDPILEGLAHLNLEVSYGMVMSDAARYHADEAIRRFEETGQDQLLGPALGNSGLTAVQLGFYDEAIDRYRRAADLATRYGRVIDRVTQQLNIGYVHARRRELAEAEQAAIEAERSCERLGAVALAPSALGLRAMVALEAERFAEAEELFERARRSCAELGLDGLGVDLEVAIMDVCLRSGRYGDVLRRASSMTGHAHAEPFTLIDLDRVVGVAEALSSQRGRPDVDHRDPRAPVGQGRVLGALHRARSLRLAHEEYRCLQSLLEIERDGGPPAPPGTAAAHAGLVRRLGIRPVRSADRDEAT